MSVVRDGRVTHLTLSDRHRPPGTGFAVGWIHAYPAALDEDATARAEELVERTLLGLGLRDGIGFPQLIAHPDGRILMIEVAARIPGGQMADLVRHAVGVDLVEVALRFALGERVSDDLVVPKTRTPVAIRFFTAQPGPLPIGKVRSASLDSVFTAPGVVQAESYLVPGETIRPVQRDGDRRGYVIAVGATGLEALERCGARGRARRRRGRVTCRARSTSTHYRELLAAARAGGYRFAFFDHEPAPGDLFLRHDVDMSLDAAVTDGGARSGRGDDGDVLLDDPRRLLQPRRLHRAARDSRGSASSATASGCMPSIRTRTLDASFDPVIAWHTPDPDFMTLPVGGALNVMQPPWFDPATYRSDSNQHWRSGCPHDELAAGSFPLLQLLVHPEIWVYEGATMRETMEALLDAERERAGARCARTGSSSKPDGRRPAARPPLPGQHGRDPVGELAGAPAARRRLRARGLQPLQAPSRGRPLARAARQPRAPAGDAVARVRWSLLPRYDVFHFYSSVTLVPKSVQFRILQRSGKKGSTTTSAPTSAGRRASSSATACARTPRSSAATTRSAGCRTRTSSCRASRCRGIEPALPGRTASGRVILHAPSSRRRKGTEHVVAACEGLDADLEIVEGPPARRGVRAVPQRGHRRRPAERRAGTASSRSSASRSASPSSPSCTTRRCGARRRPTASRYRSSPRPPRPCASGCARSSRTCRSCAGSRRGLARLRRAAARHRPDRRAAGRALRAGAGNPAARLDRY